MDLKAEDFEKLQYNVHAVEKDADILKAFPDLTRFKEFSEPLVKFVLKEKDWVPEQLNLDRNMVLRYVFYCYDKKTPFLSEKNLIRRKILCVQEAGFVAGKDGNFHKEVDDVLRGYNEVVNRMIVRFVRNQRDLRYALLVSGLENYYDNINKLTEIRKKDDAKDSSLKTDLFNSTKKMLDDLELLSDEVFNNDKELMFTADQLGEEENGRILSYPEHIASLRNKGKDEF